MKETVDIWNEEERDKETEKEKEEGSSVKRKGRGGRQNK